MRRSVPIASYVPFDHEFDAQTDMTQEFWGESVGWQERGDRPSRRLPRVDDTGSMRALRDGVAAFRPQRVELRDPSGEIRRTRSHGAPRPVEPTPSARRANASIGDLAAGHFDHVDHVDEHPEPEYAVALTPARPSINRVGLGGVDPLLARLGALLVIGVLLVPLALAMRPSSDVPDTVRIDTPGDLAPIAAGAAPADVTSDSSAVADAAGMQSPATAESDSSTAPTAAGEAAGETTEAEAPSSASTASAATTGSEPVAESETNASPVGDVTQSVESGIDAPATVDAAAERVVPECPQTYRAVPGDSWYRIADAAGVSPNALLTENRATTDTVILPGDDICLPSGATMPAPPTTDAPSTTQPSTTSPTTTDAPTTTVAATVPAGSPGRDATVDEVKAVIRGMFPEAEWDTAYTIASRESRFDPTAYNGWCCYGVFQIYWNVHQSWLDDLGITSADDLFDPLLNVRAAHAIWQRSGNSWSAWSTYDG